MKWKALRAAFPHTLPIFAGFWFLGLAYGIYMHAAGFSFVYPMLMSLLIFGGSLEFVAVEMLLSPFAPVQVLIMTLLIQARHLFYGISMLDKYKGMGWKKGYLIFGMCDETFSINYTAEIPDGVDKGWFFFFVTLLNHFYWFSGATIGGLVGSLLKFDTTGISFVCGDFSGTVAERKAPCRLMDRSAGICGLPGLLWRRFFFDSHHGGDSSDTAFVPQKTGTNGEKIMTLTQQIITIGLCILGTMLTRFLPFLIFRENRKPPEVIQYIGKYLPAAVFGMLVVYCLRNVSIVSGSHGLPELIAILVTCGLHLWKRQILLSIAGGTVCYMLLLHFVFA